MPDPAADRRKLSRRGVIAAASVSVASLSATQGAGAQPQAAAAPAGPVPVTLTINGRTQQVAVDPRATLLDTLRERLGLTGAKKGCDHGQCGACTVLIDGAPALSCLTLALAVRGPVTTIEGLAPAPGALHPMQQAFIEADGFQCGYCTPGQNLSAVACVTGGHAGSDDEIREFMSGNLCRCAAYPNIVAAIRAAAPKMRA
jgi:xanthine dehydrogenase YagT iron-sulfur-binding subunit